MSLLRKLNPFRKELCLSLDLGGRYLKWILSEKDSLKVRRHGCWPVGTRREEQEKSLADLPADFDSLHSTIWSLRAICGYLEMPRLSSRELEVACQAELQHWLPMTREETRFSFNEIPPVKDPEAVGVFYAGVPREEVETLRDLTSVVGTLDTIEVPALPLAREFALNQRVNPEAFVGLIHFGYNQTLILVVRGGYPYYCRAVTPGAHDFIYALRMTHRCDWEEAELSFREAPLDHATGPPLSLWTREVKQSLAAFDLGKLDGVYLSGGGARDDFARTLEQALGTEVRLDDWNAAPAPCEPASIFKLAVGLGIRP